MGGSESYWTLILFHSHFHPLIIRRLWGILNSGHIQHREISPFLISIRQLMGILLYPLSRSSSRWDSHFHSYVLTIYVHFYWLWELVVFYSLVRRRYIRKVSVQLVPKYFSCDCSTDSISCSERKKRMKNILKQDSNSRQKQDIVPVSNLK